MITKKNKKLETIFKKIFRINSDISKISRSKEKRWDSLNHVNLILAVESEFRIKFNSGEIEKINSFKKIESILKKKIKKK